MLSFCLGAAFALAAWLLEGRTLRAAAPRRVCVVYAALLLAALALCAVPAAGAAGLFGGRFFS